MSRFRSRGALAHRRPVRALFGAALVALVAMAGAAAPASAHPLGNFTVNRAIRVEIGSGVTVTAVLDLAEIPAYEVIRDVDSNGDDRLSPAEGEPYAATTCATWGSDLAISIDGSASSLEPLAEPDLTLPTGVGGLSTLRLVCRFSVETGVGAGKAHELSVTDGTDDDRIGWHEVSAGAGDGAAIVDGDVPATSPSALLTAYPESALTAPPDVRSATLSFTLAPSPAGGSVVPAAGTATGRSGDVDPLAALIGGALSPGVVALAVLLSLGLGAAHAVSPGHGKTLVAAYVLGSGGSARSALQIGLWVAVSHTAGVLVLGAVTLVASELLLPERLIAWLSLGSGIVVTGLGIVLLGRMALGRRGRPPSADRSAHDHDGHDHPQGHDHGHEHSPPAGTLTWRSAIALGFAGGAVPSASALIVLLVAVSTDRPLLGIGLIVCFGIGMAVVLGGLALLAGRVRLVAARPGGLSSRRPARLAVRLAPVAAGMIVLASGVAFTVAAIGQLA
jgi:nickel/cobalt transporter (NicO) family protein